MTACEVLYNSKIKKRWEDVDNLFELYSRVKELHQSNEQSSQGGKKGCCRKKEIIRSKETYKENKERKNESYLYAN